MNNAAIKQGSASDSNGDGDSDGDRVYRSTERALGLIEPCPLLLLPQRRVVLPSSYQTLVSEAEVADRCTVFFPSQAS
jgi:hypothetical protein